MLMKDKNIINSFLIEFLPDEDKQKIQQFANDTEKYFVSCILNPHKAKRSPASFPRF